MFVDYEQVRYLRQMTPEAFYSLGDKTTKEGYKSLSLEQKKATQQARTNACFQAMDRFQHKYDLPNINSQSERGRFFEIQKYVNSFDDNILTARDKEFFDDISKPFHTDLYLLLSLGLYTTTVRNKSFKKIYSKLKADEAEQTGREKKSGRQQQIEYEDIAEFQMKIIRAEQEELNKRHLEVMAEKYENEYFIPIFVYDSGSDGCKERINAEMRLWNKVRKDNKISSSKGTSFGCCKKTQTI